MRWIFASKINEKLVILVFIKLISEMQLRARSSEN